MKCSDSAINNRMENMGAKRRLKRDNNDKTLVVCPTCYGDIKVAFESIAEEKLMLNNAISCPCCNKQINRVLPSIRTTNLTLRSISKDRKKVVKHKLQKMFDKLNE